jgi:hypothetical protein
MCCNIHDTDVFRIHHHNMVRTKHLPHHGSISTEVFGDVRCTGVYQR